MCLLRPLSKRTVGWGHISPLYRSATLPPGLFDYSDPDYGGSLFYISNGLLLGREWSGVIQTE